MFKQIDENYPRKEHFHHYMTVTRCSYSLVIDLDITKLYAILKEKRLKVYPVQIYLLAKAVQKIPEFRMDLVNDELGHWELLHPSYTILNKETKTFSSIWTPYDENFAQFYKSCVADIETFSKSKRTYIRNLICQRTCSIFQVYLGLILLLLTLMYLQKRLIYCQYLR